MARTPDLIAPAAERGAEHEAPAIRKAAHSFYKLYSAGTASKRREEPSAVVWTVGAVEAALRDRSRI